MKIPAAAALLLPVLALLPAAPALPAAEGPAVEAHAVVVTLDPAAGTLDAADRMTVRHGGGGLLRFDLRADLKIHRLDVDGRAEDPIAREEAQPRPGIARYQVKVPGGPEPLRVVTVVYGGTIRAAVEKAGDLAFVAGDRSGGTISPEGVYLPDGAGWVPSDGSMATHAVAATVPEGWTVVTQGAVPVAATRDGRTTFTSAPGIPTDGLWLQAGRWKVERRTLPNGVVAGTFLSEGNAPHAGLLLDAVAADLALYEKVLGPYPHRKFDVVENFFSTGYGMPSATLLGGDVIRHVGATAARSGGRIPPGYLDHELVHGWWGNGVAVDYGSGNWCEALTTYCSNYLRKEWESAEEGARHRRGVRSRFAARVHPAKDYPLRRFTGKTEDFENDIGYGKGSMVLHGLRRAVGDEAFFGGLRAFAAAFTGKRASWDDLRRALEKAGGRNLEDLLRQGLDLPGAPVLSLRDVTSEAGRDGWVVSGTLVQEGSPWRAAVPLRLETAAGVEEWQVDIDGPSAAFSRRTADLPLRVLLDPDAHAWRGFRAGEAPAVLDRALHDPAGLEVWAPPGAAEDPLEAVVAAVRERGAAVVRFEGARFEPAPAKAGARSVLALGSLATDLGLRAILDDLPFGIRVEGATLRVGDRTFTGEDVALLASGRHPADPARTATVYAGMSPKALAAARRLFFYGGDGLVVFQAGRPVLRLEAPGDGSARVPLLDGRVTAEAERARALVEELCGPGTDGRLAGSPGGAAAVARLAAALKADGHAVLSQPVSFEVVDWDGASCGGAEGKALDLPTVPFCFSAPVTDWRPATILPVTADATPEGFLADLHEALEGGAAGVLVVGPPDPPAALGDYLLHPSRLPAKERERLKGAPADLVVSGKRARLLLPDFPVKVPVVYLGQNPDVSPVPAEVRATLSSRTVATENLFAVIPGGDPALEDHAVLLGAHHDHLGPGFPGANDNASGVAAVREAGRALLLHRRDLPRPVVLAFFGAEEWGLRGSVRCAEEPPAGLPGLAAVLNLDTVGQVGVPGVHVVGGSIYPALGALVSRCLAGAGLETGRDIDKFAFAWGSDHYSFHRAGTPAVDLFSAEYRTMHTPGDTTDTVDPTKVARLARAAAAFALAVSRGGVPR